jgi:hypothetical protein
MPKTLAHHQIIALRQPGFLYPGIEVFAQISEESKRRICVAIIGDISNDNDNGYDSTDKDQNRERAGRSMANIYEATLQHADLFRSLRESIIVWEMIAEHARLHYDLDAEDTKAAVNIMTTARLSFRGDDIEMQPVTPLTTLAEKYIALETETKALGPARTFQVAIGHGPGAAAVPPSEADKIVLGLRNILQGMNIDISTPWPPTCFSSREMLVLANPDVVSVLGGVDNHNRQPHQPVPDVHSFSLPSDLRLALCNLALVNCTNEKVWSLWLKPVGFLTTDQRQRWYVAAGRQARAFSTIPDFLAHATEAHVHKGKSFSIGLFTYWAKQSYGINPTLDITREDPDVWRSGHMIRRLASAVILRTVPTPTGGNQVQVITYEPIERSLEIKQQFSHSKMLIFANREARLEAIKGWGAFNYSNIHSRHYGGYVPNDVAADSVQACVEYIKYLVWGGGIE